MATSKAVYLSGPITGLTYHDARFGWRLDLADLLHEEITVLSPMRHEGHLAEVNDLLQPINLPKNLFSRPKMIVTKDFLDIDNSSIVVANFLGHSGCSRGALVELGYAFAKGKTIVVMMDDDGPYNHPFVTELASVVTKTIDETAAIINSLLSEGI